MTSQAPTDQQAAQALVNVIGHSRWSAVALAHGYLALSSGGSNEQAARVAYDHGFGSLRSAREVLTAAATGGFVAQLPPRERTGSAENPITKMFPATITEQRFLEQLDDLVEERPSITYADDRETGHKLRDFTVFEEGNELPINIKNAGTPFRNAQRLVGLEPEDCIPIPAYKANLAVQSCPNLLYAVSADYKLVERLQTALPTLLTNDEVQVWDLLNKFSGALVRAGEDDFVFATVRKYWTTIKATAADNPFRVISARKALKILHTNSKRTPGIGQRAWGTGASAEVNVHVSIAEDMTEWSVVRGRILNSGVSNVVSAVNRKRVEEVYDPEI